MDYVIRNHKNVYIRLNENGTPVTCSESERSLFEYLKAKNILECLPKTLKKLNFKVEPVPDVPPQINQVAIKTVKENSIKNDNYELSENISRWVNKFGTCFDILDEAKNILDTLIIDLKNSDNELLDILHKIELESSKDLYNGWKIYKNIKENRKKRRIIKDEIYIIQKVLEKINPACLKREKIQKAIDGLFTRKYTFRIVEEIENAEDMKK